MYILIYTKWLRGFPNIYGFIINQYTGDVTINDSNMSHYVIIMSALMSHIIFICGFICCITITNSTVKIYITKIHVIGNISQLSTRINIVIRLLTLQPLLNGGLEFAWQGPPVFEYPIDWVIPLNHNYIFPD